MDKKKSEDSKLHAASKPLVKPKKVSPMDKFNNAMRKILSAPKKNIK